MHSPITPTLALLGALAVTLASCASAPGDASPSPTASTGGHGAVAGAEEVAEPQLGLTTVDPDGGVFHLDLLDETVTEIGETGAPTALTTDGRYLFVETADGIDVVDSGRWTWDHVDHFHYYRASPALLGTVEGEGPVTVATTTLSTTGGTGVFFAGSAEAVLLDTEALSKGEIVELFRLDIGTGAGLVVPIGSFALLTEADDTGGGVVVGYTADGERTGLEEDCIDPAGTITTRVGAVIGCRDGALLASVVDDELRVERIPYPPGSHATRATEFDNREGRPTVAALAGDDGIWMLDTRSRAWTLLPSPAPLVSVTAVDDESDHLLALAEDGSVLVMSGADGAVLSRTEPLVSASLAAGTRPVLIADQHRAYLSAPTERRLFEIDYADAGRIARSFDTPTEPAFVAETGR
ncbi:ABC transporter [Microbacterium sp. 3J1]|uniref:ABC transporter n=1 Tax=Microbacterium sp. 3J1 TaxID=861269 RepID=UPI000B2EBC2A|nr:ABC transporter [Microbacterium sp. 3J1]